MITAARTAGFVTAILVLASATGAAAQSADGECGIFFSVHDGALPPEGIAVVQDFASKITAARVAVVTVTGHASLIEARVDSSGDLAKTDLAQPLSAARAEAVRTALYASGVPASVQVRTVAAGVSSPPTPEALSKVTLDMLAHPDDNDLRMIPGHIQNQVACIAY